MEVGVVDFPERASRTLPSSLRKSSKSLGVNAGPRPVAVGQ